MLVGRKELKVKVMGQANAVGPTSIEDSFSSGTRRRLVKVIIGVCAKMQDFYRLLFIQENRS